MAETTIQEIRTYIESLEDRIRELELRKESKDEISTQNPAIPSYDVLRVYQLYASLPVYTAERLDTPQHGEIYAKNIGGTRELCVYILGTEYCSTIT